MKKIIVFGLGLVICASAALAIPPASAPLGFSARFAGMGGAGSALVDDISAAYYNPAGIVGGVMELKLGAQAATDGRNELLAALAGVSDPAKYMADNYTKAIDINGNVNAIVGLGFGDYGISATPTSMLSLDKVANSVAGTLEGSALYDLTLTMGHRFATPGLPIANLDIGANIKSTNRLVSTNTVTGLTGIGSVTTQTGIAYDLGAKASINTLAFPLTVSIAMKDLNGTLKGKIKTLTTTYDATSGGIVAETSVEADAPNYVLPTITVIGAATTIPGIGLKVAIDQDSVSGGSVAAYSLTHIGVEYPIMGGFIALRAGSVTGGNNTIDQTTLGAGINIGLGLNIAMMTDNKNSKNNSTVVDFGFQI